MSTIKERVAIRNLFNKSKKEAPKRIEFEQTANTDKGIALYYDELVAGQPIFQKDPEGMLMPAPEGEHMLEDGTKVIIEMGPDGISMIKEVVPVAAETPPGNEPLTADPNSAAPSDAAAKTRIRSIIEEVRFTVAHDLDFENTCQALTECIKVLQGEKEAEIAKFSKEKTDMEAENKSLRELLAELEKPAEPHTHIPKKSKFLSGRTEDKNDWLERMQRIRKNLQN